MRKSDRQGYKADSMAFRRIVKDRRWRSSLMVGSRWRRLVRLKRSEFKNAR
jgi:hypothetical protein